MSDSKWKISRKDGYVEIKSEDVRVIVNPTKNVEDAVSADFIILTSKPKNIKRIEKSLVESGAIIVSKERLGKKIEGKAYVEYIDKHKGLTEGLWVSSTKDNKLMIFVEGDEEYVVLVPDQGSVGDALKVSGEVYDREPKKVVNLRTLREEEVK